MSLFMLGAYRRKSHLQQCASGCRAVVRFDVGMRARLLRFATRSGTDVKEQARHCLAEIARWRERIWPAPKASQRYRRYLQARNASLR